MDIGLRFMMQVLKEGLKDMNQCCLHTGRTYAAILDNYGDEGKVEVLKLDKSETFWNRLERVGRGRLIPELFGVQIPHSRWYGTLVDPSEQTKIKNNEPLPYVEPSGRTKLIKPFDATTAEAHQIVGNGHILSIDEQCRYRTALRALRRKTPSWVVVENLDGTKQIHFPKGATIGEEGLRECLELVRVKE